VRAVSQKKVGDVIVVTVVRRGAALNIKVKLLRPAPDLQ
jgi:hypothetical protein